MWRYKYSKRVGLYSIQKFDESVTNLFLLCLLGIYRTSEAVHLKEFAFYRHRGGVGHIRRGDSVKLFRNTHYHVFSNLFYYTQIL